MTKSHRYDATYEPLFKLLMHKKGLKTREAVEVSRKKVTVMRAKDLKEFLTRPENFALLKKKFPTIFTSTSISEAEVNAVGEALLAKHFVVRVLDQSFKTAEEETKKKAWPDRVARAVTQSFDPKGIYMVIYEPDPTFKYVMLGAVVTLTLLLCMFPAWPTYLKISAVHVLVAFCYLLLAITVVRLILFVIVWCFGGDFWLFPNMNDEYLGLVDSFKPLYSFEWRKDEKLMLLSRFISILMIAGAMYQLSLTHSLQDVQEFLYLGYTDVVEWGVDRLTKGPEAGRALPSVEQILKETADVEQIPSDVFDMIDEVEL